MPAFVPTPVSYFQPRGCGSRIRCAVSKKIVPMACTAARSQPLMNSSPSIPNDERDEDDSTFGNPEMPAYGMRGPPLSDLDKRYLESAKNSTEYMQRMSEIVRKLDLERKQSKPQSADDYIESLSQSRADPEGIYGGPRIDSADEYMDSLARKYRKDRGIEDTPLPEDRRSATAPAGPVNMSADEAQPAQSVEEIEARMRELEKEIREVSNISPQKATTDSIDLEAKFKAIQREREEAGIEDEPADDVNDLPLEEGIEKVVALQNKIRAAAGLDPTPEETSSHSEKPSTVDKQIDYLEKYLDRLKKEAEQDPEAAAEAEDSGSAPSDMSREFRSTMNTMAEEMGKLPSERPTFKDLEDTPGGMSAEEKMAAFEQLRRRAMQAKPSTDFADPYNVELPKSSKASEETWDEPSPESEAEYDAFGDTLGDKSLLIEEIETEVKAYVRDATTLLNKHKTRLQVLLARLQVL